MRLTLRTLLSWLDDTLPPDEVRRIGQQVEDNEPARTLVERIKVVTRQRRLTVPPPSGPDAVDPNRVAEYLDNALPTDQIVEFERLCLNSDVHLAEVASSHQILSMLGQKAHVPPEARYRMYHLIQGRETAGDRSRRDGQGVRNDPVLNERDLVGATPPRRPRDFVKPAAAVLLLGLLGWSSWYNLSAGTRPSFDEPGLDLGLLATTTPPKAVPEAAKPAAPEAARVGSPLAGQPAVVEAAPGALAAKPEAGTTLADAGPDMPAETKPPVVETKPAIEPARPRPATGARLTVGPTSTTLLRRDAPDAPWERIAAGTDIAPGEELVNLAPFRSELLLGPNTLTFIGSTAVNLRDDGTALDPNIDLEHGRLVFRTDKESAFLRLAAGQSTVRIAVPPGTPIGLERSTVWSPGMTAGPAPLVLHVAEGEVAVRVGGEEQKVRSGSQVLIAPTGQASPAQPETIPGWVLAREPEPDELEEAHQFARIFREDQRPLANLAEAATNERLDIRNRAFQGLANLNHLSLVIAGLQAEGQPDTRRVAIQALRDVLAGGPEAEARLLKELKRVGDSDNWALTVLALLKGIDPAKADTPELRLGLLQNLNSTDLAIRELALDNLREITNRADDLGYDPDAADREDGIRAWTSAVLPETDARKRSNR